MNKLEWFEKYMDKRWEENKKNRMKGKECIEILRSMSVGMSRTEKEAIEFAIRKIMKAKKWKRKYLSMKQAYEDAYDQGYEDGIQYMHMVMEELKGGAE